MGQKEGRKGEKGVKEGQKGTKVALRRFRDIGLRS